MTHFESQTTDDRNRAGMIRAGLIALLTLLPLLHMTAARAQAVTRSQEDLLGTLDDNLDEWTSGKTTLDLGAGPVLTTRIDAGATKIYPIVPYVSFRYSDWFALDENEARVNLVKPDGGLGSAGWRAGPMIAVDIGRDRFTTPQLKPLPKIDPTLEVGAFVSYSIGPARVRVNVRGDATGSHGGEIVELDVRSGIYQSGRFSMAAEVEGVWVSKT